MQKIGDIPNTRADSHGEFTDGNVAGGVPPTILPAEWFNTIQRELINVLAAGEVTPDTTQFNQLATAISKIIAGSDVLKTSNNLGEIKAAGPEAVAQTLANLGLGDAADALKKTANLSDLPNKATARTNLGLGDVAVKTVTTSSQDTTLGRVMQVGDGGLLSSGGVKLGNGVDLNTIIINGLYSCVAPVNGVAGAGITVLTVETYNQDWILQKLYVFDSGRLFYRTRTSTVWGVWNEIFSSASPPTPAQVGALPITGGAISGGIQVASVNVTGDTTVNGILRTPNMITATGLSLNSGTTKIQGDGNIIGTGSVFGAAGLVAVLQGKIDGVRVTATVVGPAGESPVGAFMVGLNGATSQSYRYLQILRNGVWSTITA